MATEPNDLKVLYKINSVREGSRKESISLVLEWVVLFVVCSCTTPGLELSQVICRYTKNLKFNSAYQLLVKDLIPSTHFDLWKPGIK